MVAAPQSSLNRIRPSTPYAPLSGNTSASASAASRSDNPFDPMSDTLDATPPTGTPVAPDAAMASTDLEKPSQPDTAPTSPAAPSKVPFYKRRGFIISTIVGNGLGIALLFIMLFPVVKAIIQDVVNKATINVEMATISNPSNTSLLLSMQGTVAHTSSVSAVIAFPKPVNVSWMNGSSTVPLGYMQLSSIHTSNSRATLNQTSTLYITDEYAFCRFSVFATTSQNFTWRLESSDLTVQAAKFPVAHGVSFNKMVTINGINNFAGNVQLETLNLPNGSIVDGINFVSAIQLNNPSPFSLDVGTVAVDLSYQDVYLGNGTSPNTHLSLGNNSLTSSGVLIPQTTLSNIATVTQLVTNYLGHETSLILVTGKSAVQSDGTTISWLSQAVGNLTLTVPLQPTTPIIPFGSANISSRALATKSEHPQSPVRQ